MSFYKVVAETRNEGAQGQFQIRPFAIWHPEGQPSRAAQIALLRSIYEQETLRLISCEPCPIMIVANQPVGDHSGTVPEQPKRRMSRKEIDEHAERQGQEIDALLRAR